MTSKRTYRPAFDVLEDRCVPAAFTVENLLDGPDEAPPSGSLRAAIQAANERPGHDTIIFAEGLEGTIRLTSGQLAITASLVLTGPGAARLTIDGNAAGRIFSVDDSTAGLEKVTIRGLTLFNGSSVSAGGAILSREDLTLARTDLVGNSSAGDGGAVAAVAGKLTVRRCRLIGNTAAGSGGGVEASAVSLVIRRSGITGNHAAVDGGGIYQEIRGAGSLAIRNSTITANQAGQHGGGLFTQAPAVTIDNTTLADNQAAGVGGGAAFSPLGLSANTTITSSRITGNRAEVGGGVSSSVGDITISDSIISDNDASTAGSAGGLLVEAGSLTLTDSTVRANSAGGFGGGILVEGGSTLIRGSTIADNRAGFMGGGLHVHVGDRVAIINSTISGNLAAADLLGGGRGGGISIFNTPTLTVKNSTIAFNQAAASGGGIFALSGTFGPPTISLISTICAMNAAAGAGPDLFSTDASFVASFSLIGSTAGASFFTGDAVTQSLLGQDPLLVPLANNGGPTDTHALQAGSPAIDQGSNPDDLSTDQRGPGFQRQVGAGVDIGAFERQ